MFENLKVIVIFVLSMIPFNAIPKQSHLNISSESLRFFPSLDRNIDTQISSCAMLMITVEEVKQKTPERFWSKIKFGEPNECWEWQASILKTGYGCFRENVRYAVMRSARAHRFLFIKLFGEVDSKIDVCHSCDNRKCVNPNHLWVGTRRQNIDDMDNKGRRVATKLHGSTHPNSQINENIALGIKYMLLSGCSTRDICKHFNVGRNIVTGIGTGVTWRNILADDDEKSIRLRWMKRKYKPINLISTHAPEIRTKYLAGVSIRKLSTIYKVRTSTILDIIQFKDWENWICS